MSKSNRIGLGVVLVTEVFSLSSGWPEKRRGKVPNQSICKEPVSEEQWNTAAILERRSSMNNL